MASIEWRKDGTEMLLPGDDPHISVQVSGVPRALDMALDDPALPRACGWQDLRVAVFWGWPSLDAWR